MARLGICGCIGLICCCLCGCGILSFLLFGGALFAGFSKLYTALDKCEGPDLVIVEKCEPMVDRLGNASAAYEPRFGDAGSQELKEIVRLCDDAERCMEDVGLCLSRRKKSMKLEKYCEIYKFIDSNPEFSSCASELKKKALHVDCLNFLFQENGKCQSWTENNKCVLKEIGDVCDNKILREFGKISTLMKHTYCDE